MHDDHLLNALRSALKSRLANSLDPEAVLTEAEHELGLWAAAAAQGTGTPQADILALVAAVIAEERARLSRQPH